MDSTLVSLLGSGASTILKSVFDFWGSSDTNEKNIELAKYQNSWNEKMYEKQKQDSIDFWNMQNEYNSPIATMQRLTDAGINPRGSQLNDYANAGSIQAPSAKPAAPMSYNSPLSAFSDVMQVAANAALSLSTIQKVQSEANVNNAKAQLTSEQAFNEAFYGLSDREKHEYWRALNNVYYDKGVLQIPAEIRNNSTYMMLLEKQIATNKNQLLLKQNTHQDLLNEYQETTNEYQVPGWYIDKGTQVVDSITDVIGGGISKLIKSLRSTPAPRHLRRRY